MDFTAIDFETAHGYRWSICQVGLLQVENGIITKEIDLLVQPPDNYYWHFNQIWSQIATYIENQNVVAPVLNKTLEYYGIPVPELINFALIRFIGQIWLTCAKNMQYN